MRHPAARRALAVVLTALFAMSVAVGPSAAGTVDDLRHDLNDTRDALEDAEEDLERTRDEIDDVASQVRAADATLASLEAELASLDQQLLAAEAAAAGAAERTAQARADLAQLDRELDAAEAYLAERETLLNNRAVATYMFGSVSVAEVVIDADSIEEFVNTTYYLRTVLLSDKAVVEDVHELTEKLLLARAEADRLREVVESEQAAADAAANELEAITEAQARVTAAAAAERERRAALHRELEVHEAATEAQIAELAAESAALEEELRNMRWRAGAPGAGSYVWPADGYITSGYGYRTHPIYGYERLHTGVDIGAGWGAPIVAANDGLVVSAYCQSGGYGCRIVLDHGGGIASLYAHQSSFAVAEGEVVTAGQVIGYVGSTGASTGPHLHFEIRVNGSPVDPMQYF